MKCGHASRFFLTGLLAITPLASHAESLRHLFLDPSFIQQPENVELRVNPPQQREAVILADRPWERKMISLFLTVREDQGKLRLWYICRDADNRPNLAYAESQDGVTWQKPNLGIVDYHGSKDNNLVGVSELEGVVFRDPKAKPGEEYVYVTSNEKKGVLRYFSPDGLHWKRDAAPLLNFRSDTQNVTFWDERLRQYVLYLRGWDVGADWNTRKRKVVRLALDDLAKPAGIVTSGKGVNPTRASDLPRFDDEIPAVLAVDKDDPPNSDVYNISAQPYPLDARWYVGFPSFLQRERNISDGRVETHFVGSRDGITWHRYDRMPYATPGLAGSDSAGMKFMGTGLVVRGDEIWQYGVCLSSRHGDKDARLHKTDGTIYRYVQRMDGFVSLDFAIGGGKCVTGAVKVDGPHLTLNLDTTVLGHLRVGLHDSEGKPIEGFGTEACEILRTNSTHAPVAWKGKRDLTEIQGREVRLTLTGTRAKVYSFYFNTD
jgi:hypothetical protein